MYVAQMEVKGLISGWVKKELSEFSDCYPISFTSKTVIGWPQFREKRRGVYLFSILIDPDEDFLYYWFEWGGGTNTGWLGPYDSGVMVEASHIWSDRRDYEIKVKAKDEHGAQSVWSDPLPISVPKNKVIDIKSLLVQFLEDHPYIFPLIQLLLQE